MATDNFEKTETEVGSRYDYKHTTANLSLNVLKDFDAGQAKPYVGIGVGAGSFSDEINYQVPDFRGRVKATNTVLNGNIQAGVAVALTDTISIDANAKYTCFGDYKVKVVGENVKMKNNTTDVSVGLRFAFWKKKFSRNESPPKTVSGGFYCPSSGNQNLNPAFRLTVWSL